MARRTDGRRAWPELRARRRSVGAAGAAGSRHDFGLCARARLSRSAERPAETSRQLHRVPLRRRGQGVRGHRSGHGKAARRGRRRRAGWASTPTSCRAAHGSWLFLGEIYTTLDLPADPPHANRCGTCARCLAVCPTDAFPAPYRLDATRCISYLTIEHKGSIPHELRPLMGNRIYGCDDCLAVVPMESFRPRHDARGVAGPRRSDGAAPRGAGGAGRRGVPADVRRLADQAHRARPVRAQCAERDWQFRRSRVTGARRAAGRRSQPSGRRGRALGCRAAYRTVPGPASGVTAPASTFPLSCAGVAAKSRTNTVERSC